MNGQFRTRLRLLAFCSSVLFGSLGCDDKGTKMPEVIRPVRVVRIGEAGATATQRLAGIARASKEMSLSFRVSGTLTKLLVKAGDEVKQGDLIAEIDAKDASIEVERARASVARANAEFRSAKADYERVKLLYADGSVSRSELDASRALQESKGAMLEADQKGLEMTQSTLRDHRLTAPLPGAIAEVPVEINENVSAGQLVATLNAGDKAEVEVAVPERIIELVGKGSPATVTIDSIPGVVFQGLVSEVGVAPVRGTTGFPVRVALLEPDPRVRAGLSALVELNLSGTGKAKRIFAPPSALLEDQKGQRYVMLAVPTEKGLAQVKRQDVRIGEPSTLGVVIEEGLSGGEYAIVAGLSSITEGMTVKLLKPSEPALAGDRVAETSSEVKPAKATDAEKKATSKTEAPDKSAGADEDVSR